MTKPTSVAILVELPIGLENAGMPALRRFLKALVRSYGIRCLSVLPPKATHTFGEATNGRSDASKIAGAEMASDAMRESLAVPAIPKPKRLSKCKVRRKA